jgi:hypothetical protein
MNEELKVKILKADPENRTIFGFACINKIGEELVEDLQADLFPTHELEKTAHNFALDARVQGEMHVRKGVGRMIENFVVTYEKMQAISDHLTKMGIPNILKTGCEGWFVGFKVDDNGVWESVKKGEYPAFSIGGTGKRIPEEGYK